MLKRIMLILMFISIILFGDNMVDIPKQNISSNTINITKALSNSKLDKEFRSFSNQEYKIMLQIMSYGIREDLGYTLAAIAWTESMFGRWNLNLSDGKKGSFGPFHILLEYSVKRNNVTSQWGESRLAERHLNDLEFTTTEAIEIIKDFRSKDDCDLRCAIASYNAGINGHRKSSGQRYANEVMKKIAYLKNVIKLPDHPDLDKFEVIEQ